MSSPNLIAAPFSSIFPAPYFFPDGEDGGGGGGVPAAVDGGADPGGGGVEPAEGGSAPAPGPAPKFSLGKKGGEPAGNGKATPDYLRPDKEGRLFGGRFDDGDTRLTPEMVNESPVMRKMAESYRNLETEMANRPSPHKAALSRDDLAGLDLASRVQPDGKFDAKSIADFKGKFIPAEVALEMVGPIIAHQNMLLAQQRAAYLEQCGSRFSEMGLPCTGQEVIDWVQSPDSPYDEARVRDIGLKLSDSDFRDGVMDTLAAKFIAWQEQQAGVTHTKTPEERLRTPSGPGSGHSGGDVYGSYAEAENAFISAGNDQAKLAAHEAKLARSPRALLRPGQGNAV